MEKDCIFCKIGQKKIPSNIVYEDADVIAILDISQTTKGHTLVMPKAHYDSFLSTPPEIVNKVYRVAQKISILLVHDFKAKGVNILTNCGEAAGQSVHHFHVHVIPRYIATDGFKIEMLKNEDLNKINLPALAEDIKSKM
jgi:histidine triad (HIT) family protein